MKPRPYENLDAHSAVPCTHLGRRCDCRRGSGMTRKVFRYLNTIFACWIIMLFFILPAPSNSQSKTVIEKEIDIKLLEAVQGNEIKKVKNLIAQGASVNARTEFGETPLHLAQSKEMAELLLSKGADIHAKDNEFGMTPLFNGPKEIFKLLISKGADVNVRSKKGLTPLAWSAYGDDLDRIKLLISKGADVNSADDYLKTPLHIASNWNKVEIATLLISKGANVNARDHSGWTPLHWASFEGGPEVVQLLITKGAEKNAKTTQPWSIFPAGSTPLDISEKAKHYDMAGFLKSKGCQRGEDMK